MAIYSPGIRILSAILFLALAAPAHSQAELRRENQRLTARVRELETELAAARDRIKQLEDVIEAMRHSPEPATPGTTPDAPLQTTISPDDASPAGLFETLKREYDTKFGSDDDQAPSDRLDDLPKWASRMNRDHRATVTWHVKLVGAETTGRSSQATLQAVNASGEEKYGDLFRVAVPRGVARRLQRRGELGELEGVLVLRGTVIPHININRRRATTGPFDNPPLIGPYAEFEYRVELRSLVPKGEDEDEDDKSKSKGRSRR